MTGAMGMPTVPLYMSSHRLHPTIQHATKQPPSSAWQPTASQALRPSMPSSSPPLQLLFNPKPSLRNICVPPSAIQRSRLSSLAPWSQSINSKSRTSEGGQLVNQETPTPRVPNTPRVGASIPVQGPLHRSGGKETHQAHGPPTD